MAAGLLAALLPGYTAAVNSPAGTTGRTGALNAAGGGAPPTPPAAAAPTASRSPVHRYPTCAWHVVSRHTSRMLDSGTGNTREALMGKHDDDRDGHKPGVDPEKIGLPSAGDGGEHAGGKGEQKDDKK